jgi:hypothetical protein
MWPILRYRFRGHENRGTPSPWFEPIDEEGDVNRISFSLENYLDARLESKKGGVTYHQWALLELTQGYDVGEARRSVDPGEKRRPFEPLTGLLTVRPLKYVDFYGLASWDHYDRGISSTDISLVASLERFPRRKDSFTLNYKFERGTQNTLNVSIDAWVAYGFSVGASLSRDMDLDHNVLGRYWLGYDRQCWGIRLGAEQTEEQTSLIFNFKLLGLGDVKPM